MGEYVVSGATFAAFTGLDTRYAHHFTFIGYSSGASWQLYFQINGDSGSNYSWGGSYLCLGGGVTAAGNGPVTLCELTGATNQIGSTSTVHLDLEATHLSANKTVLGTVQSTWQNTAGNVNSVNCSFNGFVAYNGASSPPSSIVFNSGSTSAKLHGVFYVEAFVPVADPTY